MCGIAGILTHGSAPDRADSGIDRAVRKLHLRGPDGHGVVRLAQAKGWIGHSRLAILDPDGGTQPMQDAESGVLISYNGEVYGFKALRRRLQLKGHRFFSDCDTEVVLRAYLEWGADCVEHLDGMFAFAIWDPRSSQLLLIRDRLGVKPLYYGFTGGRLCFASSVSALLEMWPETPQVDADAVRHYLRCIRTSLGERTLVSGIKTLQPAHLISWCHGDDQLVQKRYWALPVIAEADKEQPDFALAAGRVAEEVDRATAGQLISDVPLGSFLSGGIDSSILVSAALKACGGDFAAYSIGFKQDAFNEWEFVREAARYFNIPCEEIHLEGHGFFNDLEFLVAEKGLPLSTPNEVPIWHLAKAFKNRFTVALSGEGADEIFGGYVGPTFCAWDYDRALLGASGSVKAALERFYGRHVFASRMDHFLQVNSWLDRPRIDRLLGHSIRGMDAVECWYDEQFGRTKHCSTQEAYLHIHATVNLEGLLNRLDSSCMAASVEGRVPFTDHHLAERLFSLPDRFKLHLRPGSDGSKLNSFEASAAGLVETKRLLRAGFASRIAPGVLHRPKMSFPVPFQDLLGHRWQGELQDMLLHSPFLNGMLADDALKQLAGLDKVDPMVAWPLCNLAIWAEKFSVKS